jgi:hypothetical protein
MKTIVILLILASLIVVGTVSADYQPVIKQGAMNNAIKIGGGDATNLFGWDIARNDSLVAIYESQEHTNQLLEEQNHILWVQTCYRPFSGGFSGGNSSAWITECQSAGYPVG